MIATPATVGDTALPVTQTMILEYSTSLHTDVLPFLASSITTPRSVSPVQRTAAPANLSRSALLAPMAPSWM